MANTATIKRTTNSLQFNAEYVEATIKNINKSDKIWTKNEIKSLLQTNDRFVLNSLLKLYDYQTEEEKINNETVVNNSAGFNSADANVLTRIAEQCCEKHFISIPQIEYVRKKILKYSEQLAKIANGVM